MLEYCRAVWPKFEAMVSLVCAVHLQSWESAVVHRPPTPDYILLMLPANF